jgi:hypothetical protein
LSWLGWIAALPSLALLAWVAFWQEPELVTLTTLRVESPTWSTQPVRIVLLGDVHVDGVHMQAERVRRLALTVTMLDPDVILLSGDYIGGLGMQSQYRRTSRARRSASDIERDEAALHAMRDLRARYGVYAVIGNHDCWWDCARMREILAADQIIVLSNEVAEVSRPGQPSFWIAGLADRQTEHPDFARVQAQIPADAATLALMHNPRLYDWPANHFPVQLAGHTHGGQVRFPLTGAPLRMSRHSEMAISGAMIEGDRILVVTRGLGEVGLPVRFGAPPQIMLIEVRRGSHPRVEILS